VRGAGVRGWAGLLILVVALALAGWLGAPGAAGAQSTQGLARVGVLRSASAAVTGVTFQGWLDGLGYRQGRNIAFEHRGSLDQDPALAAQELVRLGVGVIVAIGRSAAVAAKAATSTIPIVFVIGGDPVRAGLVTSLGRPGGNVTGVTGLEPQLAGKRLEVLAQAVPGLKRAGVLWNPRDPEAREVWQEIQAAGRTLGVQIESLEASAREDLEPALQRGIQARIGGLVVLQDRVTVSHVGLVVDLAARLRMPAVYPDRYFVQPPQNGLMAYGPIEFLIARRVASHVDRILRGAKPSELPVEQPSEVELTINLGTATALGLKLPPSLLGRADKVFE
jgi:putative ABC transport system substrate-binding protein